VNADHEGNRHNDKYREDWISSLRMYAFELLGDIRVEKITPANVRDVLLPILLED
jgi:hypothetical protein